MPGVFIVQQVQLPDQVVRYLYCGSAGIFSAGAFGSTFSATDAANTASDCASTSAVTHR
jgi:hypothetical protein